MPPMAASLNLTIPGGEGALPYHPYFCEENAYLACERFAGLRRGAAMLFIFGTGMYVPVAEQRAGGSSGVVHWDYHVVPLLHEGDDWLVLDPDSRLTSPAPIADYLDASIPAPDATRFRLVPWRVASERFGSDRSHMRRADGTWREPPPPWPMIHPERRALAACLSRAPTPLGDILAGPDALQSRLIRAAGIT